MVSKKKRYVLGFLFNENLARVVLVRKKRPEWQRGLLNGVGGKIEECEAPLDAMIRECREEAGMEVSDWLHYCSMMHSESHIYIFVASISDVCNAVSTTDEEVVISNTNDMRLVVPNLIWLVPMAKEAILQKNIIAQVHYF